MRHIHPLLPGNKKSPAVLLQRREWAKQLGLDPELDFLQELEKAPKKQIRTRRDVGHPLPAHVSSSVRTYLLSYMDPFLTIGAIQHMIVDYLEAADLPLSFPVHHYGLCFERLYIQEITRNIMIHERKRQTKAIRNVCVRTCSFPIGACRLDRDKMEWAIELGTLPFHRVVRLFQSTESFLRTHGNHNIKNDAEGTPRLPIRMGPSGFYLKRQGVVSEDDPTSKQKTRYPSFPDTFFVDGHPIRGDDARTLPAYRVFHSQPHVDMRPSEFDVAEAKEKEELARLQDKEQLEQKQKTMDTAHARQVKRKRLSQLVGLLESLSDDEDDDKRDTQFKSRLKKRLETKATKKRKKPSDDDDVIPPES